MTYVHSIAAFKHMHNIFPLPTKNCILCIFFVIEQAPVRHVCLMLTLKYEIVSYNANDSA